MQQIMLQKILSTKKNNLYYVARLYIHLQFQIHLKRNNSKRRMQDEKDPCSGIIFIRLKPVSEKLNLTR